MSPVQIAAAVAAVLLVALALWRRRQLGVGRAVGVLVLAGALGVYASGLHSGLPDAKAVIEDVAEGLGPWTYALVGVLAFLETATFVGLVAPGETVVMIGGVIAAQGGVRIVPLIGLVWAAAALGDATSFFIGRRAGHGFLLRHGGLLKITPERLARVERYFDRHGGVAILIGRFIGLVRALAPFVAGASRIPYRRIAPYSVVGTGLWAALFCSLGYLFYRSFDRVAAIAGRATLAFGIVVGVAAAAAYAFRRLRRPEDRRRLAAWLDRQGRRPLLRPLAAVARGLWRTVLGPIARVAAPRLRSVGRRLTPGRLGIVFSSVLAVGGVGMYVFTLYVILLSGDTRLTPADRQLMDLAAELRVSFVVDVAKVVTELGSLPTVAVVVVFTSALLASRRRPVEAATLVAGAVILFLSLQAAKAGVDRPRPPGGIVEVGGSSYPSGHATYSSVWVAAAVALARAVPGLAKDATLVVGALVIAALIGVSRVYLSVHYWSDVAGGWGLGFGVFGLTAAVALIVVRIRQNGPDAGVTATPEDR